MFFLAANLFWQEDNDAAFLFLYNALEEDKANQSARYKELPAYVTATASSISGDETNFFIRRWSHPFEDVENAIVSFTQHTGRAFTLRDFEANFLEKPEFEDIVFFFVYNTYVQH